MATRVEAIDTHQEHHHVPGLQHQFDDIEQQKEATTIGMWFFLVQEVMFFGGLFMAYLLYRYKYPMAFAAGSNHLDLWLGFANTLVLIASSLTMALAVWSAQTSKKPKVQAGWIVLTMIFGMVFLGVKAVEYNDKYQHHLIPFSRDFKWEPKGEELVAQQQMIERHASEAEKSLYGREQAFGDKVRMFFWIYFAMTGLHALHMVIGIGIMLWLLWTALKGRYSAEFYGPVEICGLYWHFVDIVWIFLFPLLYLLGRHFIAGGGGH
ncbi:MAG TPA: cytochrome c oxidase subunit 3 family protein [Pyrinomonadaceae bacterium]|jgi:cytochrome c oxidase subunit 3